MSTCIIGAGIVGLATAYQLLRQNRDLDLTILEKEAQPALHQTGRNSGVIHSGIYYKIGSQKALNCIQGRKELLAFCDEHSIPYKKLGKVILATQPSEIPMLNELAFRGRGNGISFERIGPERLKEIEPHATAIDALYLPDVCIIHYPDVARALCQQITQRGGKILFNQKVTAIFSQNTQVLIETASSHFLADTLIACAGVHSDTLAKKSLKIPIDQILPFRGEYYELSPSAQHLVKGLIYPVPNPAFPFLGVHLTRMMNASVEAGPNAILALGKESYKKTHLSLSDTLKTLTYPGFWKMASRYWREGFYEYARSMQKRLFVRDLQKLVPAIQSDDLFPGNAGIRAQVVQRNGKLLDDFSIVKQGNRIHVLNAPSPAATASFAIGRHIANMAHNSPCIGHLRNS